MKTGSISWRLIIGWCLILFGGLLAIGIVLAGLLQLVAFQINPRHLVFEGSALTILTGVILQFAAGTLWFQAGRWVHQQRTWQPLAGCLVGYVCGVLGAMTLAPNGM